MEKIYANQLYLAFNEKTNKYSFVLAGEYSEHGFYTDLKGKEVYMSETSCVVEKVWQKNNAGGYDLAQGLPKSVKMYLTIGTKAKNQNSVKENNIKDKLYAIPFLVGVEKVLTRQSKKKAAEETKGKE